MYKRIKAVFKKIKRAIAVAVLKGQSSDPVILHKKATDKGFYDFVYYQNKYGSFHDSLAAFNDYLRKSHFSNIDPSENFDTEQYFRANIDVYHAGLAPLEHYLENGELERREKPKSVFEWNPKNELHSEPGIQYIEQNVAICLHIHYEGYIERFAQCLQSFPLKVDLFVAVKNEKMMKLADDTFRNLSTVKKTRLVVASNRGRNFGPMLVEFSDELLGYDLLCHLHSKKSAHSGREQIQWCNYLVEYLLNESNVVTEVLRLFSQRDDLGIYYPTSFWMLPSWVNHWTCNKHHVDRYFSDWGIDTRSDFLAYPVGGMFWARPKALKQWLEEDYNYEAFPPEPIKNDGTYLHAMERALGLLVERNGYKQFFYHPKTGIFTTDKSYIYIDYFRSPDSLREYLLRFDTLSFDVFDTLVGREYFVADYAKLKLGQFLVKQGEVLSAEQFVEVRNNTEVQMRKNLDINCDVSIVQIYHELGRIFRWPVELSTKLQCLEFEFDLEFIKPKPEMVAIVNYLAEEHKDIWLITDTHYTAQQIEIMLKKVGLETHCQLFISSETGLRKDNGTFWHCIRDRVAKIQSRGRYLHIGCNVRSDVQICGDYSLPSMHLLHPYDKWLAAGFEDVLIDNELNEENIRKWGPLISDFGSYPFLGAKA